jgi:hypothetical protein
MNNTYYHNLTSINIGREYFKTLLTVLAIIIPQHSKLVPFIGKPKKSVKISASLELGFALPLAIKPILAWFKGVIFVDPARGFDGPCQTY